MAQESLPIGEGGHVGGVDSQVHAVVRKPGADGSHVSGTRTRLRARAAELCDELHALAHKNMHSASAEIRND